MLSSVPTVHFVPAGLSRTVFRMPSVEPIDVGLLRHLESALGMDDHLHPGDLGPPLVDHLGGEAVVHRAVALPEHDLRRAHLRVG